MAKVKSADMYANIAAVLVAETAAGTLATEKFAFPFSIMDKMGLLIQRLEYFPASLQQLNSSTDEVRMALLTRAAVTDVTAQNDPAVVDTVTFTRLDLGTAASGLLFSRPITRDFTTLAGGGLLVAPGSLYAGIQSFGAGGVMSCWLRMYYTYMQLSADEYWQLVESRNVVST